MAKKRKKDKKAKKAKELSQATTDAAVPVEQADQMPAMTSAEHDGSKGSAKFGRKAYEAELANLQAELVAMQEWVKATGAKVCIVFEGRDTAGKGGTIKRITERVSPRVFRVVALPAPTDAREVADVHPALHRHTSRPPARSSSSTAAGTTAPASSG